MIGKVFAVFAKMIGKVSAMFDKLNGTLCFFWDTEYLGRILEMIGKVFTKFARMIGKVFAIYSLLPLAIVIVFVTAFFFRRDLHTFTFGVGVIINYAANLALKQYFAEPRPKIR